MLPISIRGLFSQIVGRHFGAADLIVPTNGKSEMTRSNYRFTWRPTLAIDADSDMIVNPQFAPGITAKCSLVGLFGGDSENDSQVD